MSNFTAGLNGIGLDFYADALKSVTNSTSAQGTEQSNAFSEVLKSAMGMVEETNQLSEQAEQAALDFTLGNTDSTHELTVAQQKAYLSLQYTVAVKNGLLDAYKEIMQMQV